MGGDTIRLRERIARAYDVRSVLTMLALTVVYLATVKAGLRFALIHGNVSPVWPASGLALVALHRLGVSRWPSIFLGASLVALSANAPLLVSLGIGAGNALEAVLGALLLRRLRFSAALERVQDVVSLIVGGALACTLASALIGTTSLVLGGGLPWSSFAEVAWVWWGGDAMGVVVMAPVLLVLWPWQPVERRLEAVALGACTLLVGGGLVMAGLAGPSSWYIGTFLFFPLAVWAALRFGPRGVALTTLLFTVFSVLEADKSLGLSQEPRAHALLLLQLFIGVEATTGLLLAAVSAGRRDAMRQFELLAAAVRGVSEGVVISEATPSGPRVVFANEAFRALVDRRTEELVGCSPREHAGEMDPETRQRLDTALREASPFQGQVLLTHGNGTRVHGEMQLSPVRDAKGKVTHLFSIYRDVTATQELRARLVAAERVAAMGTLAAGLGHELNNPLAYLELSLAAAARGLGRGETRKGEALVHILGAQEGAERIRRIVQDLRTFSREGREERKPVDLREVVTPALRMVRHVLRNRARLVEDSEPVPQVLGSEARLGQVVLNLLVNAAQAIPEGQPERHCVRIRTSTAPDGRARVEVSDTGRGISPEILPHIFEPFFTTRSSEDGTGLGLSICQQIVRAHGGEILVHSEPNQGSHFTVLLPAAPREEVREVPSLPEEEQASSLRGTARRGRILIIDDEPRLAQSMRLLLEPSHEVVTTTRGSEALELVSAGQHFDVVVCDLQMPGTSGMDVYARLHEQVPELAKRLVFISGGACSPAASDFIRTVPNRVLEKPIRPEVLLATIDAALAPENLCASP